MLHKNIHIIFVFSLSLLIGRTNTWGLDLTAQAISSSAQNIGISDYVRIKMQAAEPFLDCGIDRCCDKFENGLGGCLEFEDPNYRENPVNRCYYCKLNLYRAISNHTERVIFSGTNLADLNDYRPGLEAARGHGVRHPFIEAGIEKDSVRAIANYLNLKSLAELPASPCLSSRIETGLRIESEQLTLIDAIEKFVINRLNPSTVRCRFRKKEIVIELGTEDIELLNDKIQNELRTVISAMLESDGITKPLRFQPYKMGSAFLRRVNNG